MSGWWLNSLNEAITRAYWATVMPFEVTHHCLMPTYQKTRHLQSPLSRHITIDGSWGIYWKDEANRYKLAETVILWQSLRKWMCPTHWTHFLLECQRNPPETVSMPQLCARMTLNGCFKQHQQNNQCRCISWNIFNPTISFDQYKWFGTDVTSRHYFSLPC